MNRILLLALAAVVFVGCDSGETVSSVPDALPAEAFVLSTNVFPAASARVAAGANYLNAAVRVGVVSTVVGANLVLPVVATQAVAEATPVAGEDGSWMWSSTADVFGTPIGLELEATPSNGEVAWSLETSASEEAPFTFYTAATSLDGLTGAWSLYSPDEDGTVLTAIFDVRELNRREITFRVPPGRASGGSSVRYLTSGSEQTFDWTKYPEGERALIVWDRETRAGSITASGYNGGVRACWDASLEDVDC